MFTGCLQQLVIGLLEVVIGLLEVVIGLLEVVIGLLVCWVYFPGSIVIRSMSSPRNSSPFPKGSYLEQITKKSKVKF